MLVSPSVRSGVGFVVSTSAVEYAAAWSIRPQKSGQESLRPRWSPDTSARASPDAPPPYQTPRRQRDKMPLVTAAASLWISLHDDGGPGPWAAVVNTVATATTRHPARTNQQLPGDGQVTVWLRCRHRRNLVLPSDNHCSQLCDERNRLNPPELRQFSVQTTHTVDC